MSEAVELDGQITHLTQLLQTQLETVANQQSDDKPGLYWGQFVVAGGVANSQVGVYGSSCAAVILNLNRDDDVSRAAVRNLENYTNAPGAELELAHNIKLAIVCLALAPHVGAEASEAMKRQLAELLGRFSRNAGLWPAYSLPQKFQESRFVPRPSVVASAIIVIVLSEVERRLSHQAHIESRGAIRGILKSAADRLENAIDAKRTIEARYGGLIATAVICIKGSNARAAARKIFSEAAQKRDFADRRVFFYDCLREGGSPSRDYFILPAATLLPLVADASNASATQQALALEVGRALLNELDDNGVFKGGQDLPSTVEQGLVALSLASTARAAMRTTIKVRLAQGWLYMTQPSPAGTPTKVVTTVVTILWAFVIVVVLGKYLPETLRSSAVVGWVASRIYWVSTEIPDPVAQFSLFVVAAWSPSRSAFMRLIRRKDRENL